MHNSRRSKLNDVPASHRKSPANPARELLARPWLARRGRDFRRRPRRHYNRRVCRHTRGGRTTSDAGTARMFAALNAMMLDMLAAVARKDYEDRRRRQAQGVAKAKAAGAYRGRPEDTARNAGIAGMLRSGMSWTAIQEATGCSRATIAKVRARAA